MRGAHFLTLNDLTAEQLQALIGRAAELKRARGGVAAWWGAEAGASAANGWQDSGAGV